MNSYLASSSSEYFGLNDVHHSTQNNWNPFEHVAAESWNRSPILPWKCHPPNGYIGAAVTVVYVGTTCSNGRLEKIPMVARVSLVDYRGNILLDTFVHPTHIIEDYRTAETGLQYAYLANAPSFSDVQRRVASLVRNKILVGHTMWEFLSYRKKVLGLIHPALDTRDFALFRPMRKKLKSKSKLSLQTLLHLFMGRNIGLDYENSVELARGSMDLFRSCEAVFERAIDSGGWPCDLPPSRFGEYYS